MSDKYLMDTHKLYWHLDRVSDWLQGERIAPIHIDVGLSKGCNIRCEYCFGGMQGNLFKKGADLIFPRGPLLRYMKNAGEAGVRSMAFIGEGEPLLNPHVYDAVAEAGRAGIDTALGTNGILFDTGKNGTDTLEHLSWIRFNISAATEDAYRRIHRSKEFGTAVEKIKFCVDEKKRRNLTVTIGMQMVLTPSNLDQAVPLARLGKELCVDYFVIKQCSDSVNNTLGIYDRLDEYEEFEDNLQAAESMGEEGYDVIIKWGKVTNKGRRNYDTCLGVPFLLYSSGDGKLYPCGMFFNDNREEYLLGDLVKQSFKEILESDRYWDVIEKVKRIDVHKVCYSNCRTHAINEYLWELQHPPGHVNFI